MKTKRMLIAALIVFVTAIPSLEAQGPVVARKTTVRGHDWTMVRVAKWALLGGAVGLGAYALQNSRVAEHAYAQLRERCAVDGDRCVVENGHYTDPTTEALFTRSTSADRRAQVGIYGGQVAALGSVALFIYDLRNGQGPSDIPYPSKRSMGFGARLSF